MRQFLYLDTNTTNSILAQSENGLLATMTSESETADSSTDCTSGEVKVSGTFGGSLSKLAKLEANLEGHLDLSQESTSTATSRQVLEKTLHDASFSIAYDYIHPEIIDVSDHSNDDYGTYVSLTRVFNFVDLDYIEKLFSSDGLIDFCKGQEIKNLQTTIEEFSKRFNRETRRKSKDKIESFKEEQAAFLGEEYDTIYKTIKVFRSILPYNRMLISSDGYLIPLDEKFFRISPTDLGFKYGGEMVCVGMITNIIGEDTDPSDEQNIFATIQFTVNEMLRKILPTSEKNLCIIHPIAVFYDN